MTRIKGCGLTRVDDVQLAARLGADAIGFVMTRRSKRFVDPTAAAALRDGVPPFVTTVALVLDDDRAYSAEVLRVLRPDLLQFHGEATDDFGAPFGVRYLKPVSMVAMSGRSRVGA